MAGSKPAKVKEFSKAFDLEGKLAFSLDKKLMHSVIENDEEVIEQGKLISEALDRGLSMITPDAFFEQLIKNYSIAKNIYGESFIREATGYDPKYLQSNKHIPEFTKLLRERIRMRFMKLHEAKLLAEDGSITDKAVDLAGVILYMEELDSLAARGLGEKLLKEPSVYGMRNGVREYHKDRYRDIAIRSSIKRAVRRKHSEIQPHDLMSFSRQSKGRCFFVYALDASGSMRGEKLHQCKKAGIALAYRALQESDLVGLIVFGAEVRRAIPPQDSFAQIVSEIAAIKAAHETNLTQTILESVKLFPLDEATKHLVLITDAMPTIGENPEREVIEAVSAAIASGITISVVGIELDTKGRQLAERIAELGGGRIYLVRNIEEIDRLVLEDYAAATAERNNF